MEGNALCKQKNRKIDKIFSVRTSAWRSVRKQKRKRAEVTILYGIVEKYVKNLCIRRRWVTREYDIRNESKDAKEIGRASCRERV